MPELGWGIHIMNINFFDDFFHRSIQEKKNAFPEGFANIADILSNPSADNENPLTSVEDFMIAESKDKLTLFNSDFAVWLVPQLVNGEPVTRGYIACHRPQGDYAPELAFEAAGEYNKSPLILEALQLYLQEIKGTETMLRKWESDPS